jgi:hypothetical protein
MACIALSNIQSSFFIDISRWTETAAFIDICEAFSAYHSIDSRELKIMN